MRIFTQGHHKDQLDLATPVPIIKQSKSAGQATIPPHPSSMADPELDPPKSYLHNLLMRALSKRRTWVALFLLVYSLLLSSSWGLLVSVRSWYNSAISASASASSIGWPALYASVLYGGIFGLLSMGAALAVAVPATLVTWITVLVLLAFAGKPRRALVMEGRRITADIVGFAFKIVIREGNLVAAGCAGVSFVALLVRRRGGQPPPPVD